MALVMIADDNARYVKYAKAEAKLLESGAFVPTTSRGGANVLSRVAPRTSPYVFFGNDMDKVKDMVIVNGTDANSFIKKTERDEMIALWKAGKAGGAAYDPAAYLKGKGYTINDSYTTYYPVAPKTLDLLSTSKQTDTLEFCNCIEGLIQYDDYGNQIGASADKWEINATNTEFKFHIRDGAAWYTSDKSKYADITADDFVAGFQHMLDADGGLAYLVDGIVKGVSDYLYKGGSFDNVGIKADSTNRYVTFTVEKGEGKTGESFFTSRLAYTCFTPMSRAFFKSHGGAFGRSEFKAASKETTYTYGKTMKDQVYNSAFIPTALDFFGTSKSSTTLTKNTNYWDAANVKISTATWTYDDGSNSEKVYNDAVAGKLPGITLSSKTLPLVPADIKSSRMFVSDTDATTFFGGLNVNRGTFALADGSVASKKTEAQKVATEKAMLNRNFRLAILKAWDRKTFNVIRRGEDAAANNLRNMYTMPNLVSLSKDVVVDGTTYKKDTSYGDLVQTFTDADGLNVKLADGQDGWYNADEAKTYLANAKKELGSDWPAEGISIETLYDPDDVVTAEANSFKQLIEKVLGSEGVHVTLIDAVNSDNYDASGYGAADGKSLNQDISYGSGWGPDYGDPSTYLDTYLSDGAGYMTKVSGLF
jgi:oligopeptide transport system substrate-binding protein